MSIIAFFEKRSIEENVEKHEHLNPKLWDDDEQLLPEVRAKIIEIARTFQQMIEDDGGKLIVEDIYIIGSNANYNYTEDSDLDIHIIADQSFDCANKDLPLIYNAYKQLFNKKYQITCHGINCEVYVENKDQLSSKSNGIYSLKDGWIRKPTIQEIPDIDEVEFQKKVDIWARKCFNILINPSIPKIDQFLDSLYKLRQASIQEEGEFGLGNLIFKELRHDGYLDDLKELRVKLKSKELSLEALN